MAERVTVTVVELVYEAPLLMLIEPLGAVVSVWTGVGLGVGVGAADVVNDNSLPYDIPALFCAAIR